MDNMELLKDIAERIDAMVIECNKMLAILERGEVYGR